jgi:putative hydrolase of the HAD superfamily
MIKGVFFDLFGTLLIYTDMRKAWDDWLSALYENFRNSGLMLSEDSLALKCNGFFRRPEPSLSDSNYSVYERRIQELGFDLGLNLNADEIRKTAKDTINSWQKYVPIDPIAITVLKILKRRKKLALISNFDHPPYVYSLLSELNLRGFFDSIIISSEVKVKKPNPLIFSFALEKTKLKSSEVCYIGDTREDIEAAFNANIHPILIQRNISSEFIKTDDYYSDKSPIIQNKFENDRISVDRITDLRELTCLID